MIKMISLMIKIISLMTKNDIEVINTKIPANIVYSETYAHNN